MPLTRAAHLYVSNQSLASRPKKRRDSGTQVLSAAPKKMPEKVLVRRKTRTGCTQCKRRRVKCDEGKPTCANCIRNKLPCSLEFLTPSIRPSRITTAAFPCFPNADSGLRATSMDPLHEELFLHYHQVAYAEQGFSVAAMWQDAIPRMSLAHEFLMHGTLSISALHLASLQPHRSDELVKFAISNQLLALPLYRKNVEENKPDTIHATFAFAGFVVSYIVAISKFATADRGRIPSLDDPSPHWFHALRGALALLQRNWKTLEGGPFRPALTRARFPIDRSLNPDDGPFCKIFDCLQSSGDGEDDFEIEVLRDTIEELRRVSALPYSPCHQMGIMEAMYIWPCAVSRAYVELVHRRRPEALVILAHYCVIVKKCNSHWNFRGIGAALLVSIEKELGAKWRPYIEWALQQPEL